MVYTVRAQTAAVLCGTSHITTQQRCTHITSVDIKKTRYEELVTHLESHAKRAQ